MLCDDLIHNFLHLSADDDAVHPAAFLFVERFSYVLHYFYSFFHDQYSFFIFTVPMRRLRRPHTCYRSLVFSRSFPPRRDRTTYRNPVSMRSLPSSVCLKIVPLGAEHLPSGYHLSVRIKTEISGIDRVDRSDCLCSVGKLTYLQLPLSCTQCPAVVSLSCGCFRTSLY